MKFRHFMTQKLFIYLALMESEKTVKQIISYVHTKSKGEITVKQSTISKTAREGIRGNYIRYSEHKGLKTYRLTVAGKQLVNRLMGFQTYLITNTIAESAPQIVKMIKERPTVLAVIKNKPQIVRLIKRDKVNH